MISKLILEQREEFDKKFVQKQYIMGGNIRCIIGDDVDSAKDFFLTSHLSIIDSEITRLEGEKTHNRAEDDLTRVFVGNEARCYNKAIDDQISYLKNELKLIKQ